ncbi:hypothetical protein BO78DRAFT_388405 [Aspergillus sclerotiicarbonarius CBS 121057]|uniref:Uncharacterized protein n=1 Tax=Aspergillus sclerotiicarbonarius (strain CBS 121057 / IBT 28362) TaxID=1448318 RepID=A0A319ETS3_ASPSB|nr:hypothetical protein BO78DRAFT_388405 [Aspergillus sclerotiicarbonarius CBS 121057]
MDWNRIFLRMPQLLGIDDSAEEHQDFVEEALQEGIEWDAGDAENAAADGYGSEEDGLPWPVFHAGYDQACVVGRIHIIDSQTLASEGKDAGNVLVVFFDECGWAVRFSREELGHVADITRVDNCMLDEHGCWVRHTARRMR